MAQDPDRVRQVVFGDSGAAGSDVAWLWLCSQRWPDWTLDVVAAQTPPFGPPIAPDDATPHPVSGPPPRPLFGEAGFESVRFLEVTADPRVALATAGADASLLVVGPADGGLGPRHVGSTTEWLLRDPPCPMVLARAGRSVRTALVCADGSSHAAAAARAYSSLPWFGDVESTVFAVDDGRADVDAGAAEVAEILAGGGRAPDVRTSRGRPHREVLGVAESMGCDLIVLGNRGLTMLRHLTLGSTASAVARQTSASVLLFGDA